MIIEFEPMHVRPMTETPNCYFRYVTNEGNSTMVYDPQDFELKSQTAVGWVPAIFTLKPPQPNDGEWWMCEGSGWKKPLFYNDNRWFTTETMPVLSCAVITPLYKMERAAE